MTDDLNQWQKLAAKELKDRPLDALTRTTLEGIAIKPLYTAKDTLDLPHMGALPGFAPYTRGVKATMYAGRPWTIRQYAGFRRPKPQMPFTARLWMRGNKGSRWPLIWQLTAATILIIRA